MSEEFNWESAYNDSQKEIGHWREIVATLSDYVLMRQEYGMECAEWDMELFQKAYELAKGLQSKKTNEAK